MINARICKSCGCIYSRKAQAKLINKCPACGNKSSRSISLAEDVDMD